MHQWQGFEGLAYDSRSKPCIPTPVRKPRNCGPGRRIEKRWGDKVDIEIIYDKLSNYRNSLVNPRSDFQTKINPP